MWIRTSLGTGALPCCLLGLASACTHYWVRPSDERVIHAQFADANTCPENRIQVEARPELKVVPTIESLLQVLITSASTKTKEETLSPEIAADSERRKMWKKKQLDGQLDWRKAVQDTIDFYGDFDLYEAAGCGSRRFYACHDATSASEEHGGVYEESSRPCGPVDPTLEVLAKNESAPSPTPEHLRQVDDYVRGASCAETAEADGGFSPDCAATSDRVNQWCKAGLRWQCDLALVLRNAQVGATFKACSVRPPLPDSCSEADEQVQERCASGADTACHYARILHDFVLMRSFATCLQGRPHACDPLVDRIENGCAAKRRDDCRWVDNAKLYIKWAEACGSEQSPQMCDAVERTIKAYSASP